jgi:TP901 family phage tail tape measure protein
MADDIRVPISLEYSKTILDQTNIINNSLKKIQEQANMITNALNGNELSYKKVTDQVNSLNQKMNQLSSVAKTFKMPNIPETAKIERTAASISKLGDGWVHVEQTVKNANGQVTRFNSELNVLNNTLANDKIKVVEKDVSSLSETFGRSLVKMTQWTVAGTALFGTVRTLSSGFKDMVQMETEAVNIAKVLPNPNDLAVPQLVKPFEESSIQLTKEYGQNVIEVEKSMASWARQYKNVNDISVMTRASLLAATATDITFEGSIKNLSAIMAEWNFKTNQSIHVVDMLNEVSNNYRVTAQGVAEALAKSGSGAKALGLSIEELTGIVTTGIQTLGIEGNEIGTMWTRVMARMRGNKSAREAIDALGIDALQPLSKILDQLMVKWDTMTSAQKQNFAITVAGTQHWSRFTGIMDNYNTVLEATAKAYFSAGSAQKEVENVMATTAKHVEQLNATWQEFIYRNNAVLEITRGLIDTFRYIIEGLNKVPPAVTATIVGLTALTAIAFTVRNAFIASELSVKAFTLSLVMNPITAVVGGLTLLSGILFTVGKNASSAKNSVMEMNIKTEQLNQAIEGNINKARGINDLTQKYALLQKAIEEVHNKGQNNLGLNQKLTTVQTELAKALGLTNNELIAQLNKDGSMSKFAQNRLKETVDQINAQRQLQWQMQQMYSMSGRSQDLNFLTNFDQVKSAFEAVKKWATTNPITNADYQKIYGNDPLTKYTNQKAVEAAQKASGWYRPGTARTTENNPFMGQLEQLYTYINLIDKSAPKLLNFQEILSSGTGGGGAGGNYGDQKKSYIVRILDYSKDTIEQIISRAKVLSTEIAKADPSKLDKFIFQSTASMSKGNTPWTLPVSGLTSEAVDKAIQEVNDKVQNMLKKTSDGGQTAINEANKTLSEFLTKLSADGVDASQKFLDSFTKIDNKSKQIPDSLKDTLDIMAKIVSYGDVYEKQIEDIRKQQNNQETNRLNILEKIKQAQEDANSAKGALSIDSTSKEANTQLQKALDDLAKYNAELQNTLSIQSKLNEFDTSTISKLNGVSDLATFYRDLLNFNSSKISEAFNKWQESQGVYDVNARIAANSGDVNYKGSLQEVSYYNDVLQKQRSFVDSVSQKINAMATNPAIQQAIANNPEMKAIFDAFSNNLSELVKESLLNIKLPETSITDKLISEVEQDLNFDPNKEFGGITSNVSDMMKILGKSAPGLNEYKENLKALWKQYKDVSTSSNMASEEQNRLKEEMDKVIKKYNNLDEKIKNLNAFKSVIDNIADAFTQFGGTLAAFGQGLQTVMSSLNIDQNTGELSFNIPQLVQSFAGIIVGGLTNFFSKPGNSYNKWQDSGYSVYDTMTNFKNYEANQQKLNDLYKQKGINTLVGAAGGSGLGAIVGSLLNFTGIGALIGGILGGLFGSHKKSLDEQIQEVTEKLSASLDKLKQALGTTIDQIASGLSSAFDSTNYVGFLQNWNQSLYSMTRDALIKAFLASEQFQNLYKNLSDTITLAVLDGTLSGEEIANIKSASNSVAGQMQALYQALNLLSGSFPSVSENNSNGSSGTNYTAGSSGSVTYNIYATIEAGIFWGDRDQARLAALEIGRLIRDEEARA